MTANLTNRQLGVQIIRKLRAEGFEAYFAGGAVRDMLIGRRAKDYDIATNAHPKEVIKMFRRTLEIGAKFGVVMVLEGKTQVEVATFRSEDGYVDGRRPGKVKFSSLKEDAIRRDFTINGLYYDPIEKKVIDYVRGQKDIEREVVRAIGDPSQRFNEDYLRMLRAVRFSCQLGFAIEPKTWRAVCHNAAKISKISFERITAELEGLIASPNRCDGIDKLIKCGMSEIIFKDVKKTELKDGIKVLEKLPNKIDFMLGLAGLLVQVDVKKALKLSKQLKLSNKQVKHLSFLMEHLGALRDSELSLAGLKLLLGMPYFNDLCALERAKTKAFEESAGSIRKNISHAKQLTGTQLRPKPLLNGHQLIKLGAKPGPEVGLLSQEMYIAQLGEEIKTTAQAKKWVKQWLTEHKAGVFS